MCLTFWTLSTDGITKGGRRTIKYMRYTSAYASTARYWSGGRYISRGVHRQAMTLHLGTGYEKLNNILPAIFTRVIKCRLPCLVHQVDIYLDVIKQVFDNLPLAQCSCQYYVANSRNA